MKTLACLVTFVVLSIIPLLSRADTLYVVNSIPYSIETFDTVSGHYLGTFTTSGLYDPGNMTIDASGNLYVVNAHTIEKYSPDGSDLGAFADGFFPAGMSFDSSGILYVANEGHNAVEKYTPTGIRGTRASVVASGLNGPSGLAFDSAGYLYVGNSNDGSILRIDSLGGVNTFASASPGLAGLTFDANNDLFVCYPGAGIVEKFSPTGVDLGAFVTGLTNPAKVVFDSLGNLFVNSSEQDSIMQFDSSGNLLKIITSPGLSFPTFLAIQTVPEPSAMWILAVGIGWLYLSRCRRQMPPLASRRSS